MKGVVLAGGLGTRLSPLTLITNKHLLPVWDRPMIFYPLQTLAEAGIDEIMVIVSGPHSGDFIQILKNGEGFGLKKLVYGYQEKPDGGIADALAIAEDFSEGKPIAVILGDNTTDADISEQVKQFCNNHSKEPQAHLFLKQVENPENFGVAIFEQVATLGVKFSRIEEKPKDPKSNLAVTGLYLYDQFVFEFIRKCSPSERGELEITDVNNEYLRYGNVGYSELKCFWKDAGSFESLWQAGEYWRRKFWNGGQSEI